MAFTMRSILFALFISLSRYFLVLRKTPQTIRLKSPDTERKSDKKSQAQFLGPNRISWPERMGWGVKGESGPTQLSAPCVWPVEVEGS